MDKSNKVLVIMSTYNGEQFLREQLESLLAQINVEVGVLVRDDGSKDKTVSILKEYVNRFNLFQLIEETNVGATLSFYSAALSALHINEYEYFAFCDQDDIWEKDKLYTALERIKKMPDEKPALYYSNLMMFNNKTNLLGKLIDKRLVSNNRYNGLASINTYGCTCVFNKAALQAFCRIGKKKYNIFHDNWIYAVSMFLGSTFYDDLPHILYRQTGKNESGEKKTGLALWVQRVKKIFISSTKNKRYDRLYENIADELLNLFGNELDVQSKHYLKHIQSYRHNIIDKCYLLFSKRMKTNNHSKNICTMGRILLNRL